MSNSFVFSWDMNGIESILQIDQYRGLDEQQTLDRLSDSEVTPNPMPRMLGNMVMHAHFNTHRRYEIYAIDCDQTMDQDFWEMQWRDHPQETAELIRSKGVQIYSDYIPGETTIR